MFMGIDHVGIAVKSIEEAVELYSDTLGMPKPLDVREWPELGIKEAQIQIGKHFLHFIEPVSGSSGFNKYLKKRGEGLHHVSVRVDNLDALVSELESKGVSIVEKGAEGEKRWAFIHPKSTKGVSIELLEIEHSEEPLAQD